MIQDTSSDPGWRTQHFSHDSAGRLDVVGADVMVGKKSNTAVPGGIHLHTFLGQRRHEVFGTNRLKKDLIGSVRDVPRADIVWCRSV